MTNFSWAIVASIVVSLISLVGAFALLFNEKFLDKILVLLVGFSAGALIGAAFLHIIPEALEEYQNNNIFIYVIAGFIFFLILEKYFYWRHCHKGVCDVHVFTYLNLIGDGIHNFTDGLVIGTSFALNIQFGVVTTLVIAFHEIPQEIGDFAVLVYGGFKKTKALFYNFICGLTCILGTIIGYPLSSNIKDFSMYVLPIVAGGFIYIAACDLIPEIHKQTGQKRSVFSTITFLCGILFIILARAIHSH